MTQLEEYCRQWIDSRNITCPETVSQCDYVIRDAYEFIQDICDIIGYAKSEDEDD